MNCLFYIKKKKKYIFKCSNCDKINVIEAPESHQAKVIFDKNAPTLELGFNNNRSPRSTTNS